MDLGVGSVVFSMGTVALLSKAARNHSDLTISSRMMRSLRHSLPLTLLGVGRLAFVKTAEYQEHVSEYGVHWNFFITLACLPIFVAILQSLLTPFTTSVISFNTRWRQAVLPFALALMLMYEFALQQLGLQEWILQAPRTNFWNANKEGLCSMFGYVAILLCGMYASAWIIRSNPTTSTVLKHARQEAHQYMLAVIVSWSIYLVVSQVLHWQVSRRMANTAYVSLVVALNMSCLAAFRLVYANVSSAMSDTVDIRNTEKSNDAMPELYATIFESVNYNSLLTFLLVCVSMFSLTRRL